MPRVEFPGTACALAVNAALWACHNKIPSISAELAKAVERDGTITADALHDLADEFSSAFSTALYQELKAQGVKIL
jgi:hypothetical protein